MAQSLLVKTLNRENYTFKVQIQFQNSDTIEKITKRKLIWAMHGANKDL